MKIAPIIAAFLLIVFIISLVCLIRNKKKKKSIKLPLVTLIISSVLCVWSAALAWFIYILSNTLFVSM